jgi:chloramphenicol 3-O phosphotransferase
VIVLLNGAPRSGKSSIVAAIQETLDGIWMNVGVDVARRMTPERVQPGVGLRPGEPQHPAATVKPTLYAALWETVAAHQRVGLDVAVDVGVYEPSVAEDARRRLAGLPLLLVGVRCPLHVLEARGGNVRWHEAVHSVWDYDLEVDTSQLDPHQCAAAIAERLGSFLA